MRIYSDLNYFLGSVADGIAPGHAAEKGPHAHLRPVETGQDAHLSLPVPVHTRRHHERRHRPRGKDSLEARARHAPGHERDHRRKRVQSAARRGLRAFEGARGVLCRGPRHAGAGAPPQAARYRTGSRRARLLCGLLLEQGADRPLPLVVDGKAHARDALAERPQPAEDGPLQRDTPRAPCDLRAFGALPRDGRRPRPDHRWQRHRVPVQPAHAALRRAHRARARRPRQPQVFAYRRAQPHTQRVHPHRQRRRAARPSRAKQRQPHARLPPPTRFHLALSCPSGGGSTCSHGSIKTAAAI